MASRHPIATYALEVPYGDMIVSSHPEAIASGKYTITRAAIDPSAKVPEGEPHRATLKMIRLPVPIMNEGWDSDNIDSDDVMDIEARLGISDDDGTSDEENDEESDEESNGGPGEKTKKARAEALKKAIKQAEEDEAMDVEMTNGVNGKKKGKKPAVDEDSDEDIDNDSSADEDLEEFVLCTLDDKNNYDKSLDITIDVREQVFFAVSGGFNVHLTGNFIAVPEDLDDDDDEDYEDDEDADGLEALAEINGMSDDEDYSEEDELDDLKDPRITEVDSANDDDSPPQLVKANKDTKAAKASKKRAADDSDSSDEDVLEKVLEAQPAVNGEKLSKSQKKKLKKNDGAAADAPVADAKAGATKKETPVKNGAKEDVNGSDKKKADKKDERKDKKTWKVDGVSIDERKVGSGKQAKKGDKLGMRYIGKLKDGKIFDSNTKGEPFKFTLGKGQVIKGWDIGVQGMSVGGERRIIVPAHLAYGKQKTGGIPPNSELTFDIKLLSIN